MKKLLLLLLCVPLIFSCGEKREKVQKVEEKKIEKMKYSTSLKFFVKNDDLDASASEILYNSIDNLEKNKRDVTPELYGFIDIYTKKLDSITINISRDNFSITKDAKEKSIYILTYHFNENVNSVALLNNLFSEFIKHKLNQKNEIARNIIISLNNHLN